MEIDKALLKKALGYTVTETATEYVIDEEGNRKPVREKTQKKHIPPDTAALKAYLERKGREDDFANLTDEELEAERQRLLAALNVCKK